MTSPSSTLPLEDAHRLLKQFDCLQPGAIATSSNPALLRQALLVVVQHSDYQILGVCADTVAQGRLAIETYASALGYTADLNLAPVAGAVYIKFNPKSGLCYADAYSGEHRGVLVSCQSAYATGVNDMYGHLPLDLFATDP